MHCPKQKNSKEEYTLHLSDLKHPCSAMGFSISLPFSDIQIFSELLTALQYFISNFTLPCISFVSYMYLFSVIQFERY